MFRHQSGANNMLMSKHGGGWGGGWMRGQLRADA